MVLGGVFGQVVLNSPPGRGVQCAVEAEQQNLEQGNQTGPEVGEVQHLGLLAGGAVLLAVGLTRRGVASGLLKLGGAAMLYKGAAGYQPLREALGMSRCGDQSEISHSAIRVESSVDVDRPAGELYQLWRDFENLPAFMTNVLEVDILDPVRSHWMVKGPGNMVAQWDAEVIKDIPNELIAWKTIDGSSVDHAGSVHFEALDNGMTRIRVVLRYDPPAGAVGTMVAKLARTDPQRQVDSDLGRFKRMLEGFARLQSRAELM
jgi:uncharacterized membrane protein